MYFQNLWILSSSYRRLVCLHHGFFRCVKQSLDAPSVHPSVCTSAAVTGRIWVKIDTRDLHETCREQPNLITIGQNSGYFTWWPMYSLLFLAKLNMHKSIFFEWICIRFSFTPRLSSRVPPDGFTWTLIIIIISNLSNNRYKASSKTIHPHSAI